MTLPSEADLLGELLLGWTAPTKKKAPTPVQWERFLNDPPALGPDDGEDEIEMERRLR